MSAPTDLAIKTWVLAPERLDDAQLVTLGSVDPMWRDNSLEARAAGRQAEASPPANARQAIDLRVADTLKRLTTVVSTYVARDAARADELRTVTTSVDALRAQVRELVELAADRAARQELTS